MCSRVSLFTASGRENARETVDLWTPAAFATTSILKSDMFFSSALVVIGPPNGAHDVFELGQGRQAPESIIQRPGDAPHERIVKRVAVHIDLVDLRGAVQCRERRCAVRINGGESRLTDGGKAAVALKRGTREG